MAARLPRILLTLALVTGASSTAQAQEWRLSLGKRLGHGGEIRLDLASHGAPFRDWRRPTREKPCAPAPGHYEVIEERVWVEGCWERVWVPDRYDTWVDSCGRTHRRLVCAGHYETVRGPGHYETRTRRVWVQGGYPRPGCGLTVR